MFEVIPEIKLCFSGDHISAFLDHILARAIAKC